MMNSFFAPSTLVIQSSLWTLTLPKRLCTGLLPSHSTSPRRMALHCSHGRLAELGVKEQQLAAILADLPFTPRTSDHLSGLHAPSPEVKRKVINLAAAYVY
jgi:hypothetical protein